MMQQKSDINSPQRYIKRIKNCRTSRLSKGKTLTTDSYSENFPKAKWYKKKGES